MLLQAIGREWRVLTFWLGPAFYVLDVFRQVLIRVVKRSAGTYKRLLYSSLVRGCNLYRHGVPPNFLFEHTACESKCLTCDPRPACPVADIFWGIHVHAPLCRAIVPHGPNVPSGRHVLLSVTYSVEFIVIHLAHHLMDFTNENIEILRSAVHAAKTPFCTTGDIPISQNEPSARTRRS